MWEKLEEARQKNSQEYRKVSENKPISFSLDSYVTSFSLS